MTLYTKREIDSTQLPLSLDACAKPRLPKPCAAGRRFGEGRGEGWGEGVLRFNAEKDGWDSGLCQTSRARFH